MRQVWRDRGPDYLVNVSQGIILNLRVSGDVFQKWKSLDSIAGPRMVSDARLDMILQCRQQQTQKFSTEIVIIRAKRKTIKQANKSECLQEYRAVSYSCHSLLDIRFTMRLCSIVSCSAQSPTHTPMGVHRDDYG